MREAGTSQMSDLAVATQLSEDLCSPVHCSAVQGDRGGYMEHQSSLAKYHRRIQPARKKQLTMHYQFSNCLKLTRDIFKIYTSGAGTSC